MSSPYFYGTPKIALAAVTTANTAWDGSGTLATVFTGASSSSVVVGVVVCAADTTTEGHIKFFIHDGSNNRRVGHVAVTAVTVVGSVAPAVTAWAPLFPLIVPSGGTFKAASHKSEPFHLAVSYGDL